MCAFANGLIVVLDVCDKFFCSGGVEDKCWKFIFDFVKFHIHEDCSYNKTDMGV